MKVDLVRLEKLHGSLRSLADRMWEIGAAMMWSGEEPLYEHGWELLGASRIVDGWVAGVGDEIIALGGVISSDQTKECVL